jgi:hypothetical protein
MGCKALNLLVKRGRMCKIVAQLLERMEGPFQSSLSLIMYAINHHLTQCGRANACQAMSQGCKPRPRLISNLHPTLHPTYVQLPRGWGRGVGGGGGGGGGF